MLSIIIVIVVGLMLGSFYACIGYRIPNKVSIVKPRSYCPQCKKQLKWYMNIPIFSYLFLKGECAYCKKEISIVYPAIEIFTVILFLLAYLVFGFSPKFIIVVVLSSVFLITLVSDFIYYYISDRVIVTGLVLLIINSLIFIGFKETMYSAINGAVMFVIMYIIKIIGDRVFKKESLGGGDIKLMALIGFSLGIISSMCTIILGSIIALPFALITLKQKKKEGIIPYGPFLLAAALIIIYCNAPFQVFLTFVGL